MALNNSYYYSGIKKGALGDDDPFGLDYDRDQGLAAQRAQDFLDIGGQSYKIESDAPDSAAWQWNPAAQSYATTFQPHPTEAGKWIAPEQAFNAALKGTYQGDANGLLEKIFSAGPLIGAAALGGYALGPGFAGTEAFNAGAGAAGAGGAGGLGGAASAFPDVAAEQMLNAGWAGGGAGAGSGTFSTGLSGPGGHEFAGAAGGGEITGGAAGGGLMTGAGGAVIPGAVGAAGGAGGLAGAAGTAGQAAGAASTLGSLFGGGGGAGGTLGSILAGLGQGALGYLGADKQADAFANVQNRYLDLGAPYRGLLSQSYQPGFSLENEPGYQGALDTTTNAFMRAASAGNAPNVAGGNPLNNPGAWAETMKYVTGSTALPYLQNYRNTLAGAGGLGVSQAGQASTMGAQTAGGGLDAIGYGLGTAFNAQPNILDIYKLIGRG